MVALKWNLNLQKCELDVKSAHLKAWSIVSIMSPYSEKELDIRSSPFRGQRGPDQVHQSTVTPNISQKLLDDNCKK